MIADPKLESADAIVSIEEITSSASQVCRRGCQRSVRGLPQTAGLRTAAAISSGRGADAKGWGFGAQFSGFNVPV